MVHNDDGLLDIPLALQSKGTKRALRMATLSKEDKMKAQLMMSQMRVQKMLESQKKLEQLIINEAQKA